MRINFDKTYMTIDTNTIKQGHFQNEFVKIKYIIKCITPPDFST